MSLLSCRGQLCADHLNYDSQIVNHRGCVSPFDDSCDSYGCDVVGSLIHGYV